MDLWDASASKNWSLDTSKLFSDQIWFELKAMGVQRGQLPRRLISFWLPWMYHDIQAPRKALGGGGSSAASRAIASAAGGGVAGEDWTTVQSSLHSLLSVGSPAGKYSGGNGYNPQPTPDWQKPLTSFFTPGWWIFWLLHQVTLVHCRSKQASTHDERSIRAGRWWS